MVGEGVKMTELKPEFKKWLTEEILGECLHKFKLPNKLGGNYCIKCSKFIPYIINRSFTTWQDYGDVVNALQISSLQISSKYNFEEILSWMMNKQLHYLSEMLMVSSFFLALQEWWEQEGK